MISAESLAEVFVDLADTLVADFDIVDMAARLTEHGVQLLSAAAAGLMLADQRGSLRVLAASSEQSRLLELFQVQTEEGPCVECVRSGQQISLPEADQASARWPRFAPLAIDHGFQAMYAFPLRLRGEVLGALNLFYTVPGPLPESDLRLGQSLADIATIGILQERAIRRQETVVEQLQAALNSRVTIEQAKGILAHHAGLDMDKAFNLLRGYARTHNTRLSDIARRLVDDRTLIDSILLHLPTA